MTITEQIAMGSYDNELNIIMEACRVRIKHMAVQAGHQLNQGDRVRFTGGRPRYLIGLEATVVKVMHTWVTVKLDRPVGKFAGEIRTPMTLIEKVS